MMRNARWWHTALALLGTGACASPPAGPTPVAGPPTVEALAPGTELRVSQGGRRVEGVLASVDGDSIRLRRDGQLHALARTPADTVWARARRTHNTARTGLLLGLVVGGIVFAAMRQDPVTDGYAVPASLGVAGVLVAIGLLGDAAQGAPWLQVDPLTATIPSSP